MTSVEKEQSKAGGTFQKDGEALQNDRSENFSFYVSFKCARRRWMKERLEPISGFEFEKTIWRYKVLES